MILELFKQNDYKVEMAQYLLIGEAMLYSFDFDSYK